jgi:hypothetical protein
VVHFVLGVLQVTSNAPKTNIFMIFVHFETVSGFEPGLNVNWTSQTRSDVFGPRFSHMAEPEPAFSSGFAIFAQELD